MHKRQNIRPSSLAAALASGQPARGFQLTVPVPMQIELLGTLDFDFVYLDAEHGIFSLREIEDCCRAAELWGLTVAARLPSLDETVISHFLDCGVQGVIAPHVDTPEQAAALVAACRYAPRGLRPSGGARAAGFWGGVTDMTATLEEANRNITITIQLESREACQRIDELLAVPGIDYFTIGKQDLSQSLGYPRLAKGFHPEVVELVQTTTARIRSQGGKLKDDVMAVIKVSEMLLAGGKAFLAQHERGAK